MSSHLSINSLSPKKKPSSKKAYLLAAALSSSSLYTGVAITGLITTALTVSMSASAASLSDLFGNSNETPTKFLPVDQAFQVTSSTKALASGTRLAVNFDITPEHYVYKDQIKLDLPAGVSASALTFSQKPVSIDDPTYGQVPVFDQANMVATTTLTSSTGKSINNGAVTIGWQGCAKAGLCYPPEKLKTTVTVVALAASTATNNTETTNNNSNPIASTSQETQQTATTAIPTNQATDEVIDYDTLDSDAIDYDSLDSETIATSSISGADTDTDADADADADFDNKVVGNNNAITNDLENTDPFGLTTHLWLAFGLLFLAGLLLALTPCVLPMLPIVTNIVARQQHPTVKKSVLLITSYAVGVSTAYGILGALVAVFGVALGVIGWFQNPVILISFAIVFVLLALYMLGVFSIRLPRAISNKLQRLSQAGDSKLGSMGGSLVAGFLSALVVSPCVSAPLSGALVAVSTIGSPLLGFVALFILGFGLSTPLILLAATQGKIMPKAGEWMNWVKIGFALLLFAVALLLIERVFISPVMLLVWALWFMVVATWAWSWFGKARMLTQALSLVFAIWATILIIGAALGNDDSLNPLESLNATTMMDQANANQSDNQSSLVNSASDKKITSLAELDAITDANPKVLVDVTAEWCIECRIMEKNLFTNRPTQMQDWQLVRLDITDTTEDSKAILARYQLFGPPSLLYYKDGQLVSKQVGEIGRQEFEQTLTILNK